MLYQVDITYDDVTLTEYECFIVLFNNTFSIQFVLVYEIIFHVVQEGKTPLDIARYKQYDKVVEVFQCHGVQVNVPDEVSDMSYICVKLCK